MFWLYWLWLYGYAKKNNINDDDIKTFDDLVNDKTILKMNLPILVSLI